MAIIKQDTNKIEIETEEGKRSLSIFINQVHDIVNGGLEFQTNIAGTINSVSFVAANTEIPISHKLNRVPQGYMIQGLSANMVIFNGTTPSNKINIYLQSSAIGTAQIFIF